MVWIDTSTTDFKQTQKLAAKAKIYGVSMLEATLTGGVHALQNNNMVCLAGGEKEIFNNDEVPSRQDVIEQLIPYIKDELKKGTRLNQIMRHTLGLFHGQSGASYWKRYLSENMCVRNADVQKIDHIMDKIKYNNVERRVG